MKPIGNLLFLSLAAACQSWLELPSPLRRSWSDVHLPVYVQRTGFGFIQQTEMFLIYYETAVFWDCLWISSNVS